MTAQANVKTGGAYYNEHDPFAAAWLRALIAAGLIAPGEVDERSIEDVTPDELAGFVQCHFFAGIGVWSLALRQAGWPDDEPIWTGSCPCQPFSAAGKGGGFDDERHLWPAFHWLIEQSAPAIVLGEQVASQDGLSWLNLVSADLEATGYAFGAIDTCAAGFGAPHIRQRLYWMADATAQRPQEHDGHQVGHLPKQRRSDLSLADADDARLEGRIGEYKCPGERSARPGSMGGGMGNAANQSRERRTGGIPRTQASIDGEWITVDGRVPFGPEYAGSGMGARPGPLNGLWRAADWLCCTDGKWRPVAPGTFPLAPTGSVRNRVGTLRGAGNAINLAQAQGFIEAVMEVRAGAESIAA